MSVGRSGKYCSVTRHDSSVGSRVEHSRLGPHAPPSTQRQPAEPIVHTGVGDSGSTQRPNWHTKPSLAHAPWRSHTQPAEPGTHASAGTPGKPLLSVTGSVVAVIGAGVLERPPVRPPIIMVVGISTLAQAAVAEQRSGRLQKSFSAMHASREPRQLLAQQLHQRSVPTMPKATAQLAQLKAGGGGAGVGGGVIGMTALHHCEVEQRNGLLQNRLSRMQSLWKPPQSRPQQRLLDFDYYYYYFFFENFKLLIRLTTTARNLVNQILARSKCHTCDQQAALALELDRRPAVLAQVWRQGTHRKQCYSAMK